MFNEIITVRTDDAALKKLKVIAFDLSIENLGLVTRRGDLRYLASLSGHGRTVLSGLCAGMVLTPPSGMVTGEKHQSHGTNAYLTTKGIVQETRQHQALIEEYAHWIEHELLRTQENGFTHCTSDHLNEEQLWADTLFMSGLFYAYERLVLRSRQHLPKSPKLSG
ncbi:MAG: glycoside hydrolase family 88 protein [Symbiopectobacterium sp.]